MKPGQPILPKIVKAIELAFGVRNVNVEVTPKIVREYEITKEIRNAPIHIPLLPCRNKIKDIRESRRDEEIYASRGLFPPGWYKYRVGCGLNKEAKLITHVTIHIFPVPYAPKARIYAAESVDITITYEEPKSTLPSKNSLYDLVIIAPSKFSRELRRVVDHKNSFGVATILKTTEEIYREYSGVDKPEQIKYFIKDALENWGIKYVLLVGGLKSLIYGKPRDNENEGTKHWHLPVRYSNLYDHPEHALSNETFFDPASISDLYYSDIYRYNESSGSYEFEDWDPNGDGIFAAWGCDDVENDTYLDLYPDVFLGRVAWRNRREVRNIVNKIIKYERKACDPSWFKKMIVVSGDGFLDQQDLDIQWDINDLPDGEYTIYARSTNKDGELGPVDIINVTLDRTAKTNITFNHDDHLRTDTYPFPPITEITSPSEGDILGYDDFFYKPREDEAYCNNFTGWANVSYENGIMHIRGKSYDPRPYGNITHVHVWINNSDGETVYSNWTNDTEMYYEGEWITGEKLLQGRGGALYYMPEDFEKVILWTSNGKFTGPQDVIEALSQGCGFVFFSGHGSPNVWADHEPGIPGNRKNSMVTGLKVIATKYQFPFVDFPIFPMNRLLNKDMLPVVVIGGCHNSQFNVSLLTSLLDVNNNKKMWTHGAPAPECFSWYLVKLRRRGAIATIGNTGLGYGILGKDCTIGGLDGWISTEFFRQYSEENHDILGKAYGQTIISYLTIFNMEEDDHAKTVQQWVLLRDPSLKIGGYS
jgi:hypothetical protein